MRRGFTLIELSVSVTLLALLVPLVFMLLRSFEEAQLEAVAQTEAAASMRSISEELRRDLKTMGWSSPESFKLAGVGQCKELEYWVNEERVLIRQGGDGCGPARAIAANVRAVQREAGALRVVFSKRVSARRERTDSFYVGFTR